MTTSASLTKQDAQIRALIETAPGPYYDREIREEDDFSFFYHLSRLRTALLSWYPFREGCRVLDAGSGFGALTGLLLDRASSVTAVERDPFRAEALRARFRDREGLQVICSDIRNFYPEEPFDYIIAADLLEEFDGDPEELLSLLKGMLRPEGVLLLGIRNRNGIKYRLGALDEYVREPGNVDALTDRASLETAAAKFFREKRVYYPLPDIGFAQAVYTDDFLPDYSIRDRVFPYDPFRSPLTGNEQTAWDRLIREGRFGEECNYLLFELGDRLPEKHVIHAALSTDRDPASAFATILYGDGCCCKRALFPEGVPTLAEIRDNLEALSARGIAIVPQTICGDESRMPLVRETPLLAHIRDLMEAGSRDGLLAIFEAMYRNVLLSSEEDESGYDAAAWGLPIEEARPVLRRALIDMIPYNAFLGPSGIRYYDQEFAWDFCPARFVLFRAVRFTYIHLPGLEELMPAEELRRHFGITPAMRDRFFAADEAFISDNRSRNLYNKVYEWAYRIPR